MALPGQVVLSDLYKHYKLIHHLNCICKGLKTIQVQFYLLSMSFSYKPNTISWFYYNHSGLLNDLCESSVENHFIKKVDNVYLINTKPQSVISVG